MFEDIREFVLRNFKQVAESKKLQLQVGLDDKLPKVIRTDGKRLQQILKNLLSNAFKFTTVGRVDLDIYVASKDEVPPILMSKENKVIAFTVKDTGIGIPKEKHQIIFEAFQQADGTTSRKYGGTGLGLSISKQISHMLGGEIRLESEPEKGSTFTLYIPIDYVPLNKRNKNVFTVTEYTSSLEGSSIKEAEGALENKLSLLKNNGSRLLPEMDVSSVDSSGAFKPLIFIIEDDPNFADILRKKVVVHGFNGMIIDKAERVLQLARQLKPAGIILDIYLANSRNGWVILDQLKHDLYTRHIPVQIITASDELIRGNLGGAIATLPKPVSQEQIDQAIKNIKQMYENQSPTILLIESNVKTQNRIKELLKLDHLEIVVESVIKKGFGLLSKKHFNCVVVNSNMLDEDAISSLNQLQSNRSLPLPVIVFSQDKLTPSESNLLKRVNSSGQVHVVQHINEILDKAMFFLHLPYTALTLEQKKILETRQKVIPELANKKILIVDDDIRNIFALTSALERYNMQILFAENGRAGIETLHKHPDIQFVLMDIMMPEMDGYETIERIRKENKFEHLPIVALTAKAMQDDRKRCLDAGATDYITKPVDTDQLISLLKVHLYEQ
jgi:CheY-like chemotaxis protein